MNTPIEAAASWRTVKTPQPAPVPAVAPLVPNAIAAPRHEKKEHLETDGRQRAATLENVVTVLQHESAPSIAYDVFQDTTMIADRNGVYRRIVDEDRGALRLTLGRGGFKPVPDEIMKTAISLVARDRQFDSAIRWAGSLVWDGVRRIDEAMPRYFATSDTPYTRAVGAYLFTALAGRALVPGIQADMAVILVGAQGTRKTSAVRALAPFPGAFGEIDLNRRDDDLARRLRGKLVVEWSEMRGLAGRDLDEIKAWLSRRREEWIEKHKEHAHTFERRCIVIGTANRRELLHDETGERRMLPVNVGPIEPDAIERDRAQLWAEGVARFRAGGIEWATAEELARTEHGQFKVYDEWETAVLRWLAALPLPALGEAPSPVPNGERPFVLLDLFRSALRMEPRDVSSRETRRIRKILRRIGYEAKTIGSGADSARRWRRVSSDA